MEQLFSLFAVYWEGVGGLICSMLDVDLDCFFFFMPVVILTLLEQHTRVKDVCTVTE